jgi:cystathionine beta-synthase
MIFRSIIEMIGKTPMIELPVKNTKWKFYLKMEKFNPGQSMKDRMALSMIIQAEKDGLLKPGGCIIESSSGNTAIGLSMIAAERGYKFIAVVDHHAAKNKIAIMKAYGAEIVYIQGNYREDQVAVKDREAVAKKLRVEIPNSFFCNQADNPANADGYFATLGQEIIDDTQGQLTTFVGAIGTGGSLCGCAKKLKTFNPDIEVIGVEPLGSVIFGGKDAPYYQSGTGNPGNVAIAKNVNYSLINLGLKVNDKEAFNTCRFLAKNRGLLIGGSSGGVVYKGLEIIQQSSNTGIMVALIADSGEKYVDTIFDDEWMLNRELIDTSIEEQLQKWVIHS